MDPIALTRTLCEVDSTTGQEGPVAELLARLLAERGWTVERQPVAPGRFNLWARRADPVVVFSTHLDTVPPYLGVREDDEWLHGRGTCDAKGLAAAMVSAAERLAEAGERRVGLLFLVGEENGSDGAKAAAALGPKGRFLINGEPTENQLTVGQKGVLRVDVRAEGRAAHSAYPDEGSSAIVPLLETLRRIRRLPLPYDPRLGTTTLNIGTIRGGVAPNVIPDRAEAQLLYRTVGPLDRLKESILATREAGVTITFPLEIPHVTSVAPPGWETTVVSFASDLPFLHAWGEGFQLGPGSIRVAHTDEERIRKADLLRGVALYEKLARDLIARAEAA